MFGFGFGPLMVGRCLTWLHLSRLEPLSPNHTLSTRTAYRPNPKESPKEP